MSINGSVARDNPATTSRLMAANLLVFDLCKLVVHECSYTRFITTMAGLSTIGGRMVFCSEIG
jgi:hypothetical protein